MLTALGKFLRKLRIDNSELLKNMSDKLQIAPSTLSSIESGRRNPPKGFAEKIKAEYKLNSHQMEKLEDAICLSRNEVEMRIKELPTVDKELAVAFARRFENLSKADKDRIKEILNGAK